MPRELDQIINKALMRDRDKRYQRADEMVYDLHGFLYGLRRRTSGAEMSAFMRDLFGDSRPSPVSSPNLQMMPSAPSDSFEETLEADGLSSSIPPSERRPPLGDPELVDDQTGLESDLRSSRTLPPGDSDAREERTAIVSVLGRGPEEAERGVREQNTAIVSNPLAAEEDPSRQSADDLLSQPTQIRSSPENDPEAAWIPFAQWSRRQRVEAAIALAFGLLWLGLSVGQGFP